MHNKSSKNGSARFWPTPQTMDAIEMTRPVKMRGRSPRIVSNNGVEGMAGLRDAVASPAFTETSSPSTEPTTPGLTCSQVDFLASLSALPGSVEARQMTVRSGLRCSELSRKRGPLGSLVKMLAASSRWSSSIAFLQWTATGVLLERQETYLLDEGWDTSSKSWRLLNQSDTMSNHFLFRLVPSMPDTAETEYGLWPTPNAMEGGQTSRGGDRKGELLLGGMVKMWPTPRAEHDSGKHKGKPDTLNSAIKMWPTPTEHGNHNRAASANSGDGLSTAVKMWPTPRTPSATGGGTGLDGGSRARATLTEREKKELCGGALNPKWVEWLMNYPPGWTEVSAFSPPSRKTFRESPTASNIAPTGSGDSETPS